MIVRFHDSWHFFKGGSEMARRSTRWMGFFVSAAFATAAVALLTAGDHAWALPGSSIPQTEMDDLLGAGIQYLICDSTNGPLCISGFFCSGMGCTSRADCDGCYLAVTQGFCTMAGAGFFDYCKSTLVYCAMSKHGYCDWVRGRCVCVITHSGPAPCYGVDCQGGC